MLCYVQDSFPAPCGPESIYSTLSEKDLTDDVSKFKYFALNNLTILAVLEKDSLSSHKQGQLKVNCLAVCCCYCGHWCVNIFRRNVVFAHQRIKQVFCYQLQIYQG